VDVKVAAKLANMTEEDFLALNPAFNKPVAMGGKIVLPIDKADDFKANLETWDKPLVSWTTYNARRGESLDTIARKHGVTGSQLRAANDHVKLDRRGRLRMAGPILVPLRGKAQEHVHLASLTMPTASSPAPSPRTHVASINAGAHAKVSAFKTYKVRSGDTLYSIAQRFNTAVPTLQHLNHLGARSVLRPGITLKLP
jgi:membrane-bound lytic murein transglycosylase D